MQNIIGPVPMPDGYVFVPKGDMYVTRHCRSKTKESHQAVYVVYVSAKPKLQAQAYLMPLQNKSGRRIQGIQVPAEIHANVVQLAKLTSGSRANAVQARDTKILSHGRKLLREQFPLMPEESLEIILNHSFLKGSGRVGRTSTTTDKRKATLAVEAHIRHKLTSYEKLLSAGTDRKDARETVWPTIQAIRTAWQGDAENKENDAEGLTLRQAEVVVLD
jgi:hypothetical protein